MRQPRAQRHRLLRRIQKILAENDAIKKPGSTKSTFGLEVASKNAVVDDEKELAATEEEDNA